ncbi:TadE/TadG family type IV pilus assembly protein [Paenibacillus radicis (ex Gao et al. 2016)]|uniref:Uncharacterized protein n=1 Tax=Paenibacillus radicis (ex Gao et al. 2016) TaxID=1737354 RepID=A0A917HF17_9BACL|nr:hypothetical protein [Paenibacillus radicis (ex Gao et al. 2016)]GGG76588.1 hypothetical protein GCM10010918_36390 [Paenibacillus radicis (ex Gao et al. 2016)]
MRFTTKARSLFYRTDGAVTVLSAMMMSSLLLFSGVLIDYARMAALHKAAEDAARAGTRSVLSAYDGELYGRYGLFGRGGTEGDSIYELVATANLERKAKASDPAMRLVQPELVSAHANASEYLGTHRIFKRQLMEEMKYKAPVDFTLELAAKFAPMAGPLKEASITVDLLERLRKLYEQREALLQKVLDWQRKAAHSIEESDLAKLLPEEGSRSIGANTSQQLAAEHAQYAEWVRIDEALAEAGKARKFTREIEDYVRRARELVKQLDQIRLKAGSEHDALSAKGTELLEQARTVNEQMKQVAEEVERRAKDDGYDRVAGQDIPGADASHDSTMTENELKDVQESAGDLVLPEDFFAEYRLELDGHAAAYERLDDLIESFNASLSEAIHSPELDSSSSQLMTGVNKLIAGYGRYSSEYMGSSSIVEQRQRRSNDDLKQKKKEQEKKADSLWRQARAMLEGMKSLPEEDENKTQFQEVKRRYEANLLFNQQEAGAEEAGGATGGKVANDAHEQAESSVSLMGSLFGGMADTLEKTRDSVYAGEYVLSRFSAFQPQHLKSMITDGDTESLKQSLALQNQEAEYILYGFYQPAANVAAAYGELFGARMAIRTMEGLVQCRSVGHPLLILTCSLIYGLEKTMEDFVDFSNRGAAPLSKYAKVDISYTDYLRLFMLMHGGADRPSRLARMIAVIEQNRGITLSYVPTAVTGEVQAAAELWFLPGAYKMIGGFGFLQGKVVDGRYETTQTVGWSY